MMQFSNMTERDLQGLREIPKTILEKSPRYGYREENGHRRCDLDLQGIANPTIHFGVFIRQNNRFIENFSLGLRYQTGDRDRGTITLVRYNGAHGEQALTPDAHFARPHIHYLTAQELAEGHLQPRDNRREVTDRYATFEDAIRTFLQDIGTIGSDAYFPELTQLRLFDGC